MPKTEPKTARRIFKKTVKLVYAWEKANKVPKVERGLAKSLHELVIKALSQK